MHDTAETGDPSGTPSDAGAKSKAEHLADIIVRSPVVAFRYRIADGDWIMEYISENVSQLGYPAEAFVNGALTWADITRPEDMHRVICEVRAHLHARDERWKHEFRLQTRSGDPVWLQASLLMMRDSHDRPTHAQGVLMDITERKKNARRSTVGREQLRALTNALATHDASRGRRLAAFLHDQVGQDLVGCHMLLDTAARGTDANLAKQVPAALAALERAMSDLRRMTFELSSPVLEQLGLVAALDNVCDQTTEQHGLPVQFSHDGDARALPEETQDLVYRAARELLFNVTKHAEASAASIHLSFARTAIELTVQDDGAGFDPAETGDSFSSDGGFGLFSLKQRLGHLGGSLSIVAAPQQGTAVRLICPTICTEGRA